MLGGGERGIGGVSVSEMQTSDAYHPGGVAPVLRAMQIGAHFLFLLLLAIGVGRVLVTKGADGWWIVAIAVAELLWYGCGVLFARGAETAAPSTRRPGGRGWASSSSAGWRSWSRTPTSSGSCSRCSSCAFTC